MKINNIEDLAAHLGAYEDTAESMDWKFEQTNPNKA